MDWAPATGTVHRGPDGCIVYRLYGADGTLLYVGKSVRGPGRCYGHPEKPWVYAEYEEVKGPTFADALEAKLIHELHPPLNGVCYRCDHYRRLAPLPERIHAYSRPHSPECKALNSKGRPCRSKAKLQGGYCEHHQPGAEIDSDPSLTRLKIA